MRSVLTRCPSPCAVCPQFFLTFWALLGDFDVDDVYEELGSAATLMPMLLFTYTFLTTIFLVNLLIAQMTNIYEKIKERSKVTGIHRLSITNSTSTHSPHQSHRGC